MPRKKVGVKKLRSSKKKSVGMIDKEELLDIIHDEKWAILQPKIDLVNAQLKIEELEEQIDNPDYYDDRGNNYSPTFHGQLEEAQLKSDNAEKMIAELDSVTAFFMGIVITMSSIATVAFVLLMITS